MLSKNWQLQQVYLPPYSNQNLNQSWVGKDVSWKSYSGFTKVDWEKISNLCIAICSTFYKLFACKQNLKKWSITELSTFNRLLRSFLRPIQISDERLIEGSWRFAGGVLTGLKSSSLSPFYIYMELDIWCFITWAEPKV